MSAYNVGYNFNPGDTIWILDTQDQAIVEGKCAQTNIMVVLDTTGVAQTTITYLVLLNCGAGTMSVDDTNAFSTLQNALTALQTYLTNLVCPPVPVLPCLSANKQDERSFNNYDNYEDSYCHQCGDR